MSKDEFLPDEILPTHEIEKTVIIMEITKNVLKKVFIEEGDRVILNEEQILLMLDRVADVMDKLDEKLDIILGKDKAT